ncbi:MAG: DNA topoisomerase IB, partial [Acidobacteriota bacterium]
METKKPLFDIQKAKAAIEKGRRSKWWIRSGSPKRGFAYLDSDGKKLTDAEQLERIRLLVIPPAWKFVRIAPSATSRVQAVGMDTTGRVQYIYDPKFADRQQRKKFSKIERFGEFLPSLRKITNEHIALEGFPKEKVLAIVMRLINSLYFRVGTEKSARHYKTYGITTLKNQHLSIGRKGELIFEYVGKSHIKHRKGIVDA